MMWMMFLPLRLSLHVSMATGPARGSTRWPCCFVGIQELKEIKRDCCEGVHNAFHTGVDEDRSDHVSGRAAWVAGSVGVQEDVVFDVVIHSELTRRGRCGDLHHPDEAATEGLTEAPVVEGGIFVLALYRHACAACLVEEGGVDGVDAIKFAEKPSRM